MFYDISKRVVDVVGAIVALILFSPVYLVIAIAVKLDSKGPVFYVHERVTQKAQLFKMWRDYFYLPFG